MEMLRLPVVCVVGSGSDSHEEFAQEVGGVIASLGVHLLTGGGGGVMASVSKAFVQAGDRKGISIGVIPSSRHDRALPKSKYPNKWVELPIYTHLPLSGTGGTQTESRNHINVLSSNAVVALPGGAGTASECALALEYGRPIVAYLGPTASIPTLDSRIRVVPSIADVEEFLKQVLSVC
ncbi:MAG: LOG family protein [Pirellulales bacterium]|nr:LOG family protein [Pirellulales bacterium]